MSNPPPVLAKEKESAMLVISGPRDVCICGHLKNFHIYLNQHPKPGEPIVDLGPCCKCDCGEYREPEKEEAA